MQTNIMQNKILKGGCLAFLVFSMLLISAVSPLTAKADGLGVTVTTSPSSASVGQTVTYSASATGGTAPYTYSWSGDCSGSSATCQNSYSLAGSYTASVLVSSSDGSAVTGNASVTVNGSASNPLTVSVTASPNPASVGQTVTYSSSASGGNSSYTYSWSGDCSGSGATCQNSYSNAGNYTASVLVTSGSVSQTGDASVTVSGGGNGGGNLGVSVTASPSSAAVNQTVTFTASATGGNGSYNYSWSGDCSGSGATCQRSYASAGNYVASVLVTSAGASVTGNASVTVSGGGNGGGTLGVTVTASPNPANTYQTITFTASPIGGNGNYTYIWSGDCTGSGSTCQASFSSSGVYTTSVLLTSGGAGVTGTRSVNVGQQGNILCSTNSQCGTNGTTGGLFCQNNNVYQNYITYTCNNPGTTSSYCSNATNAQLVTACTGNQVCSNGTCNNNPTCTPNYQERCSGNNLYWYDSCGNQGSYIGTCGNTCTPNYQEKCTGNSMYWYDSCGNQGSYIGTCGNNNCSQNYQQKCSGNNLYWYDSCGDQGSFIQYCANGCYGNTCNNNNNNYCTPNYQERCSGNGLYWYDSCGNQESLIQYCSNGCYSNSCQNITTSGTLFVTKTVRNLTTGSGFAASTYASPSDTLMFMITLQANGSQDVQNVFVRDTLPANLIYANQLVVARTNNASGNYSGDITSGINLGTIPAGQTVTITYQTQVAPASSFTYGVTTLNNNVQVTSSNTGTPSANASVIVTKSTVLGASTVSTGLTNNFWVDSFFLPLLIALMGLWMWRSGMFFGIEKWLENKQKVRRTYKAEKELTKRIAQIKGAK